MLLNDQTPPLPPAADGFTRIDSFVDIDAVLRNKNVAVIAERFPLQFAGDTLVTLDGDAHRRRRRIEMPTFEPAGLSEYESVTLRPAAARFLAELSATGGDDDWVSFDLVSFGRSMLVRLGASLAGIDGVDTQQTATTLYSLVEHMARGLNVVWVKGSPDEVEAVLAEARAAQDIFRTDFFEPSRRRREQVLAGDGDRPKDVLTSILENIDDSWHPDLPLREVFLYLSASIDTSTRVLCNAVHEVLRWQGAHPEMSIYTQDPQFAQAVTQETLRLHPALPALMRKATQDLELPSGRRIAAGERMALVFASANRDRGIFGDDADEFVPARAERLGGLRSHGLAFGGGAHTCIGRRLAAGGVASGGTVTQGTVGTLLGALLSAGIERDPGDEPVRAQATYQDAFDRYPVRIRARRRAPA